jgi:hypothetical protein
MLFNAGAPRSNAESFLRGLVDLEVGVPEEHPATKASEPTADTHGDCYQPWMAQQEGCHPERRGEPSDCECNLGRCVRHHYLLRTSVH